MGEVEFFAVKFVGAIEEVVETGGRCGFFIEFTFVEFVVSFHFLEPFDIKLPIIFIFLNGVDPGSHLGHTVVEMLVDEFKNIFDAFPYDMVRLLARDKSAFL